MESLILSKQPTAMEVVHSKRVYDIVSTIAYLIGVAEDKFERETLRVDVYQMLHKQSNARILRTLCSIRTALIRNHADIRYNMTYNLGNIDRMPEFFDREWFSWLSQQNIHFIRSNYKVESYIADANRIIAEHVKNCSELFPSWIEWEYIKTLFLMPMGAKETGIKKAFTDYANNRNFYPFQMYMNWSMGDQGNILLHDGKFLYLLYQAHGQQFDDLNKVRDANASTKNGLYNYIVEHDEIVMIVDCENSDPYKFCSALRSISLRCGESMSHIRKIILYDDSHSSTAWRVMHKYIDITIEHNLIQRVLNRKSLVDISLTTGVCREFYQNKISSFIMVTSDSDFWGVISALPNASFYLMVESEKCSGALQHQLSEAKITYCFTDLFASGNINDLKEGSLAVEVSSCLEHSVFLNTKSMFAQAYTNSRIPMTDLEKKHFENKVLKGLRVLIDENGDVSLAMGSSV